LCNIFVDALTDCAYNCIVELGIDIVVSYAKIGSPIIYKERKQEKIFRYIQNSEIELDNPIRLCYLLSIHVNSTMKEAITDIDNCRL